MDRDGKYWTVRGNIGQRREILDSEEKYLTETEKYWTETGSIGQRGIVLDSEGKYWIDRENM